MATMHCVFRRSVYAHKYVTSVRNQRIEAWWSYFRRNHAQWWMDFFHDLYQSGTYDPDHHFHKPCMQYCMMAVLQCHLDAALELWNSHTIRPSNAPCPAGIPDEMYYLPEQLNTTDYIVPVRATDIDNPPVETCVKPICVDPVVWEYVEMFRTQHGIDMPLTPEQAVDLFKDVCGAAL